MKLLSLLAVPAFLCGVAKATPVTCGPEAPCVAPPPFNDFRYDRLDPLGAVPGPAAADIMVSPIGTALNAAYVYSAVAELVAAGVPMAEEPAVLAGDSPLSRDSRGSAESVLSRAVGFAEHGPAFTPGRALTDPDSALPGGRVPPVWTGEGQGGPGTDGSDPAPDGGPADGAVAPEPIAFALIGSALLALGVLARYKRTSV